MKSFGSIKPRSHSTLELKKKRITPLQIAIPPPSKEVEDLLSPVPGGIIRCNDCDLLVSRIHEISILLQKSEKEKQELFISLSEDHKKVVDSLNEMYKENTKLMEELLDSKKEEKEIEKEIEKKKLTLDKLEKEKNRLPRVAMLSSRKKE